MATEFCPRCGTARIGAFRFCRPCGFDFDAAGDPVPASPSTHPPEVVSANAAQTYIAYEKVRWQLGVWRVGAFIIGMAIWLVLALNFSHDYFGPILILFFVTPAISPYIGQLLFFSRRAGRR